MKRTALLRSMLFTAALIILLISTASSGQVVNATYQFYASQGYYGGKPVYYLMTDASDSITASTFMVNYTPLLANALNVTSLPVVYYVTNKPQGLIFSAQWPGTTYAPIWILNNVTWSSGGSLMVLKSAADVQAARSSGSVRVRSAGIVIGATILINSNGAKIPQARVSASGSSRFIKLPIGGMYVKNSVYYMLRTDFAISAEANAYQGTYSPLLARFNALRNQNVPPAWQKLYSIFTRPVVGQLPVGIAAPGDANYSPLVNEWTVYSSGTPKVVYTNASALTAALSTSVTNYMSYQPIVGN